MEYINALGQKIGFPVLDFTPPAAPDFTELSGRYVTVAALQPRHFNDLYQAFARDRLGGNWTYLTYGPFATPEEFSSHAAANFLGSDPKFYAFLKEGQALGQAALMRIDQKNGVIEIGHIHLSPWLQRTQAGTEGLMLLMAWAFQAGYRRVEWKCDALNAPSNKAALRLGFRYEGLFRQAVLYKGRNRDTTWYSIIDKDFPALHEIWQSWLKPENFVNGIEQQKLSHLTANLAK